MCIYSVCVWTLLSLRCIWDCEKPLLLVKWCVCICIVNLYWWAVWWGLICWTISWMGSVTSWVLCLYARCTAGDDVHVESTSLRSFHIERVFLNASLQRSCLCFHRQPWGKWLMPQPLRHRLRPSYAVLQGSPMQFPSTRECVCMHMCVFIKDLSIYLLKYYNYYLGLCLCAWIQRWRILGSG